MSKEEKLLKRHLERVKDRDRKRVKCGYKTERNTGTLGEFIVLDLLQGADLVRKPAHDIKTWEGERIEVKTSIYHDFGWEFNLEPRKLKYAHYLTLVCLNKEKKLEHLYTIPNSVKIKVQNLWLGSKNREKFEPFRII